MLTTYSTVPRDLGCAARVFRAKHDPDMVLGHRQMNVIKSKQLTGGHHTQRHAETVQLPLCNAANTSTISTISHTLFAFGAMLSKATKPVH